MIRGGSVQSNYLLPNGVVEPPDNFTIRGSLNGGKVNRLKKAEKWRDFSGDTVNTGLNLGDKAWTIKDNHDPKVQAMRSAQKILGGKKVSRIKKATQWRDFSGDTINTGLDLGDKAWTIKDNHDPRSKAQASLSKAFGGAKQPSKARINAAINKLHAFSSGASNIKPTKLQLDVLQDIGIIELNSYGGSTPLQPKRCNPKAIPGQSTRPMTVGGAKKPPSAWIQHVQRYMKANGGTYKDAMKNAKASYKK